MDTITRQDQYFDAMSGGSSEIPEPITRKEQYYAKMAGEDVDVPEPITREEFWLHKIIEHGGGGGGTTTIEPLTVTENGSYSEAGKAYSPVNVNVPQPSGSTPISENGVHNVTAFAEAVVNVPNSYTASDEGKVVSNGALVSQTSQTIDSNGTYDTTLKNEVVVNVPTGGGVEVEEGAYKPATDEGSGFIHFSKTHDKLPNIVMVWANTTSLIPYSTNYGIRYENMYSIFGNYMKRRSTTGDVVHGWGCIYSRSTSASYVGGTETIIDKQELDQSGVASTPRYWATEEGIYLPAVSGQVWSSAYTYNWKAVWL